MRTTTTQKLSQLNWLLSLKVKDLTLNTLSTVAGSEWQCECILEALAIGRFELVARALMRFLADSGNQFSLTSRQVMTELIREMGKGNLAQALVKAKELESIHRPSFAMAA